MPSDITQYNSSTRKAKRQAGQIAVEYVLLITVVLAIGVGLVSALVSRNENEPGLVIQAWMRIVYFVSGDTAGEADP